MSGVLKQIRESIKAEISHREGGTAPDRDRFIQLKFNSPEELKAGSEIFRTLISTYSSDMVGELVGNLIGGGKGELRKLKDLKIKVSPEDGTLTVHLFAGLPLKAILNDLDTILTALNDININGQGIRVQFNPSAEYFPIFTRRSLEQNMEIFSHLARLHDLEHFSGNSLFSASGGLGKRIGNIAPDTPAVLIEKGALAKIQAAELGEDRGRASQVPDRP